MLRSLNAGVSGLQQFQQKLDVVGNNIANSNTLGFKMARAEFEDTFSQSLNGGTSSPIQVGSGVSTGSVRSVFQQGDLGWTGVAEHMGIDGDGFFSVRDPLSGSTFVTRAGDFRKDDQGYLITNTGYRLQGYSDSGLSTTGDIRIDDTGRPEGDPGGVSGFSVDANGKITVILNSKETFVRGQVLLQRFMDPHSLIKEGNNLYSATAAAGAIGSPQPPDTNGTGKIGWKKLEQSNVDLAGEFATLITTQRGFQASARIISTSDEVLQEVVNLKR